MQEEIDRLINKALSLITQNNLSEIVFCPYHGHEIGNYFCIQNHEIPNRIKYSIYEGFSIELFFSLTQLIICVWEYPGPKPDRSYAINFIDIPPFEKNLEGE